MRKTERQRVRERGEGRMEEAKFEYIMAKK
jgi:hypothetical protein